MNRQNTFAYGFWLLLGLSGGMLVSDLTDTPTAAAFGATSRYNDYVMATGRIGVSENDCIWLLDYSNAYLHSVVLNRNGVLDRVAPLDLKQLFELEGDVQPHFMMVTGTFGTRRVDLCYVAETSTGQMLCIAPYGFRGNDSPPYIMDKFSFQPNPDA